MFFNPSKLVIYCFRNIIEKEFIRFWVKQALNKEKETVMPTISFPKYLYSNSLESQGNTYSSRGCSRAKTFFE